MKILPARVHRRVVPVLAAAIIATGAAVIASGAPASAHYPTILASVECAADGSYTVLFTAEAWLGETAEQRTNPDIRISAALDGGTATQVGSGAFNEANGFQFSGQFTVPASTSSVELIALANANWANWVPGGQTATTGVITPPECEQPPSAGGCTPGYWKNHLDAWQGYSPGATVGSVFAVPAALDLGDTMLSDALTFKGGSTVQGASQILLRAATAALLSASHGGIDYAQSASSIITSVNGALATGDRATILALAATLDAQNNAGCPL